MDENLTKMEKAMDIPGPLLAVRDGNAYCLSADRRSVVCLPAGMIISTFDNPVENEDYFGGKWILYEKGGNIWYWAVEAGAVAAPKR